MPHLRKRYLAELIPSSLAFSPIVGILGHRQVGKTTLVEKIAEKYVTLDDKASRDQATREPKLFLSQNRANPLVIDECQKSPQIFDQLKEYVRVHKKPGQFLLTGSVRFTSKKAIQESLTGRIIYHELLPLSVSEIEHRPLPSTVRSLIQSQDVSSWLTARMRSSNPLSALSQAIRDYQVYGGLPGVFHIRNEKLRTQRIHDQIQTILDRDLREVISTRLSFSEIFDFAQALAKQEGSPLSYTQLIKDSEVTAASAKKLLSAFESTFLIRLLKIEGGKKGFVFYFEDQAESRYLSAGNLDPSVYYSGFLYRSIRAEFAYAREHQFHFFHYLTRHNTTLPFAVAWNGKYLGFLPIQAPKPSHAEIMAAQSFLKRYNNSKVVMIHPSLKPAVLSDRIVTLPDFMLL